MDGSHLISLTVEFVVPRSMPRTRTGRSVVSIFGLSGLTMLSRSFSSSIFLLSQYVQMENGYSIETGRKDGFDRLVRRNVGG